VCKGFNMDFGGDQMAVYLPLSLDIFYILSHA
jgi:DNA-directed RNA polymerase beta' subunit